MRFLHLTIVVSCLLARSSFAYYLSDQLEQIEQKYETPDSEDQGLLSNVEQAATYETLNQALSQLEPSQVKGYGDNSASNIPQSLLGSSSYESASNLDSPLSSLKGLEGKSSEYSKVTQIPSGSMFAMPDKGTGSLEFQSPFSKQPYSIVFRTHSMPVKIKQQHQTLPAPEVEFVRSQEEAHRIKHEVVRPVIQEVHEIIQPYRRVIQEIKPVQEEIQTIIAKGEPRGAAGGQGVGGGGAGGLSAGGHHGGGGGGLGGGAGAGGLSVGYSENQPRYAAYPQPQQQQQQQPQPHQHQYAQQFRTASFNQMQPVQQAQYPIAHYSALSHRSGLSHSRY